MGTTIWSPLASGILTGKYNDGIPANSRLSMKDYDWLFKRYESSDAFKKARELTKIADELNTPLAQIALAWCLKNQNVSTVITGASSVKQVQQNLASLEVINKLNDEVMLKIDTILDNKPVLDIDWRER